MNIARLKQHNASNGSVKAEGDVVITCSLVEARIIYDGLDLLLSKIEKDTKAAGKKKLPAKYKFAQEMFHTFGWNYQEYME